MASQVTKPKILVLDGGLGHLLKQNGLELLGLSFDQQFLAGAVANEAHPRLVREAHEAYLLAGSDVITTNSFACTPYNLSKIGRAGDVGSLVEAAAKIADAARRSKSPRALVAGSIPPLKESGCGNLCLASVSYQVDGLDSDDQMLASYQVLVSCMAPLVDILLLETLSTAHEVCNALRAAATAGKPIWLAVTLEDSTRCRLRSGERLQDVVEAALSIAPSLEAVLVNCCAPAAVTAAVLVLAQHLPKGIRYGGYANGFKTTTTEWLTGHACSELQQHEGDYDAEGLIRPDAYLRHAMEWISMGATVVGGCCGVGPEHIAAIRKEVDVLAHKTVE